MSNALTLIDMSPRLQEEVGRRSYESHRRKSRMVEISLSGSGEGPGRVTSRPTLQRAFACRVRSHPSGSGLRWPLGAACNAAAAAVARPRSARACRGCPWPGRHCRRHHHRRPQPGQPAAEASGGSAAVSRSRSWLPAHESPHKAPRATPVREARDEFPRAHAGWRRPSGCCGSSEAGALSPRDHLFSEFPWSA